MLGYLFSSLGKYSTIIAVFYLVYYTSPELWDDHCLCPYDMEVPHGCYWEREPYCCSAEVIIRCAFSIIFAASPVQCFSDTTTSWICFKLKHSIFSGSMEPAFYRGDLLFLWNNDHPVSVGDIPVFKLDGREIPIVHRVITVHDKYASYTLFTRSTENLTCEQEWNHSSDDERG